MLGFTISFVHKQAEPEGYSLLIFELHNKSHNKRCTSFTHLNYVPVMSGVENFIMCKEIFLIDLVFNQEVFEPLP